MIGRMRVLYISYTGILEPLGQSQVLNYLKGLAARHELVLISYEKPGDWSDRPRRERFERRLRAAGIDWHPLKYHQRFSLAATAYDILRGFFVGAALVRRKRIQIVHARSYVASVIAHALKKRYRIAYIFDMRGFWPDERVDAGTWSRTSLSYRLAKRYERLFLTRADGIVSLTRAGVAALRRFPYLRDQAMNLSVIPTCADLERFHPPSSRRTGPFTLGYVGNAGGWYRFEPVIAAFHAIRQLRPGSKLLIVNKGQHEEIRELLGRNSVPADAVELTALDFEDVPNAIRQMHATAFFIQPTFANDARAPTRLAEFLGCGVPCLVNEGSGDVGQIVRERGVGVVVEDLSGIAAASGARKLVELAEDPATQNRCVRTARDFFSLEAGITAYDELYRRVATDPRR